MGRRYDHLELNEPDAFADWQHKISETPLVADEKSAMPSRAPADSVVQNQALSSIFESKDAAAPKPTDADDILILSLGDMIVRKQPQVDRAPVDNHLLDSPHSPTPSDVYQFIKDARAAGHVINEHNEHFARVKLFGENMSAALWYNVVLKVLPGSH